MTANLETSEPGDGTIKRSFARMFIDVRTGAKASCIADLFRLGSSTELDTGAINVFLRTGMFLGDTTPFQFIRTSLPDVPVFAPCTLTRAQILEAYIDLFRQAMRRCFARHEGEPFTLGLSGGRDSRHILLEVVSMKKTPKSSWTIQTAFTEDIAVAGKLARRVGVPHIVIPAASGLSAELERNALTNFCSLQHTWMLAARQAVREAANAYDGIGGDVLSESSIVTGEMVEMFERGKLDAFAERLVPDRPLPPFARTALFPDRNDAIERVLNEASRHLAAVNPASSFFFWNRTRRDIAESAFTLLASTGATVHAPFLDDDLFAFLASLPPNQTVGTHLHTASISRAFPDFQDIPYAGKQIVEPSYPSRTAILAAMTRLARARGHIIDKPALFVRLFFSLLTPAYGKKSGWIIPMGAYLAQISNPQRIF